MSNSCTRFGARPLCIVARRLLRIARCHRSSWRSMRISGPGGAALTSEVRTFCRNDMKAPALSLLDPAASAGLFSSGPDDRASPLSPSHARFVRQPAHSSRASTPDPDDVGCRSIPPGVRSPERDKHGRSSSRCLTAAEEAFVGLWWSAGPFASERARAGAPDGRGDRIDAALALRIPGRQASTG